VGGGLYLRLSTVGEAAHHVVKAAFRPAPLAPSRGGCGAGKSCLLAPTTWWSEGIQTDGHRGLTPSRRRRPVEGRLPCGYGEASGARYDVDPFADDLATLGLDLIVAEAGWAGHGPNPFLLVASGVPC
jgi:hypothetical protein